MVVKGVREWVLATGSIVWYDYRKDGKVRLMGIGYMHVHRNIGDKCGVVATIACTVEISR